MISASKWFLAIIAALMLLPILAYAGSILEEMALSRDALERFAVFAIVGIGGMIGHYVKKWIRGEIHGNLIAYIFCDHPRQTALAVATFLGTAASLALTGQLDTLTVGNLIVTAITTGYTVDSAVNKGAPA